MPDNTANIPSVITPDARTDKHIALIVHSVKLTPTEPGLDRAAYIATRLSEAGYHVDVITSSFQHWQKAQRNTAAREFMDKPYNIIFIDEPGYKKNIDPARIWSHHVFNRNLKNYLKGQRGYYDVIWAQIPPNNVSATASAFARSEEIPFIVDVNDLWPQAMRMVLNIPVISDIAFSPMTRDARRTYDNAWGCVGTSDEYAHVPDIYRKIEDPIEPAHKLTVYVGNDLARFDAGVAAHAREIEKPNDEIWVTYAGTLGKSYDLETLIYAADIAYVTQDTKRREEIEATGSSDVKKIRLKILGDGPDRAFLEERAGCCNPGVIEFLGYTDYDKMAAYLDASDIVVNSLVEKAPQSIVSKIADYLASGTVMISTGTSREMKELIDKNGVGVSVAPDSAGLLSKAICELADDDERQREMGLNARKLAEERFDRATAYEPIVGLVDDAVFSE